MGIQPDVPGGGCEAASVITRAGSVIDSRVMVTVVAVMALLALMTLIIVLLLILLPLLLLLLLLLFLLLLLIPIILPIGCGVLELVPGESTRYSTDEHA